MSDIDDLVLREYDEDWEPPKEPEKVAWNVEIHDMHCIVFATTKAKAKWIAVKAYWEAYGRNMWPRPVAGREPRFDKSALRNEPPKAYSEDHVISYPNTL